MSHSLRHSHVSAIQQMQRRLLSTLDARQLNCHHHSFLSPNIANNETLLSAIASDAWKKMNVKVIAGLAARFNEVFFFWFCLRLLGQSLLYLLGLAVKKICKIRCFSVDVFYAMCTLCRMCMCCRSDRWPHANQSEKKFFCKMLKKLNGFMLQCHWRMAFIWIFDNILRPRKHENSLLELISTFKRV